MSLKEVYITRTSHFLPNNPVSNDEIEEYLGLINGKESKSKWLVLRNNKITRRFYAMEKGGKPTHTNAEMAALAVRHLFKQDPELLNQIQLLACGTSSPDQMMPSHGVMVHGWLPETGAIEVVSPSGNCCSGMHALKFAHMSIAMGHVTNAVTTGSERLSRILYHDTFEEESHKLEELHLNPLIAFEKDFLRWMLSDGAAAFYLSNQKNQNDLSLRIDWIESTKPIWQCLILVWLSTGTTKIR